MPDYSNRNKLDLLSEQAGELVSEINKLNNGTGQKLEGLSTKVRRSQTLMWIAIASFLVDVAVTLVLGFTIHTTQTNTDRIDKIQSATSDDVLCPLYQQFINADTPKAREFARSSGQDMKVRAQAFQVIRDGYAALHCTPKD